VRKLVELPKILGMSEEADDTKDYAAEAMSLPREAVADHLDEYEHFGNRRLRTVGELIQEAFRIGLYRMERVVASASRPRTPTRSRRRRSSTSARSWPR
jgi:DNA-directed RNA polymerase subunit beta